MSLMTPNTRASLKLSAFSALSALLAVTSLTGCTGTADAQADPTPAASSALTGELTVYAAASLQDTFEQLGATFEQQHPDVTVTFNFGASSTLAQQIDSGAPVDVFAAANTSTMDSVADLTEGPEVFARNSLEIVVPVGNPGQVTGLADLADPDLTIALCAEDVPCGSAAATAFAAAGITPAPDTYEKDVTATLTKAVLGEVDAALVYRTDVISAGDRVQGIAFPEAAEAMNDYPIAVLTSSDRTGTARAFMELVRSPAGQDVLTDAGFDAP